MKEKLKQGGWPAKAPVGYRNDLNTRSIVIDPESSLFIVKAFEMYADGVYSIKTIREKLIEEEFTINGKNIAKSNLHKILQNPFYIGTMVWEGKEYSGKHTPLISEELFYKVQERLQEKRRPKKFKRDHLYGNLITCGVCGATYTTEVQKGHTHYRCTEHYKKHSHKYWREEDIDKEIQKILNWLVMPKHISEEVKAALRESHKNEIKFHGKAMNILQINLTKIQKRKDQVYEDKLDELISREKYLEEVAKLKVKEKKILRNIKRHKEANLKYFEIGCMLIHLTQTSSRLSEYATKDQRKEMVKFLFSNLKITNENIELTLNTPLDSMYKLVKSSEWSGREDSNLRPRGPKPRVLAN